MRSRFWGWPLLWVAVMTALTLFTGGQLASDHGTSRRDGGGRTAAMHEPRVDELAVLFSSVDPRLTGSERSSKPRLALFAVAAALLAVPLSSRRRMVVLARPVRFSRSPAFPQSARAPPFSF